VKKQSQEKQNGMQLKGYKATIDNVGKLEIDDTRSRIRIGMDIAPGKLLALLDWMTWRLQEARDVIVDGPKTIEAETLLRKLKGF
jgi:hypothetical protein